MSVHDASGAQYIMDAANARIISFNSGYGVLSALRSWEQTAHNSTFMVYQPTRGRSRQSPTTTDGRSCSAPDAHLRCIAPFCVLLRKTASRPQRTATACCQGSMASASGLITCSTPHPVAHAQNVTSSPPEELLRILGVSLVVHLELTAFRYIAIEHVGVVENAIRSGVRPVCAAISLALQKVGGKSYLSRRGSCRLS